jgi:hypothetical protein
VTLWSDVSATVAVGGQIGVTVTFRGQQARVTFTGAAGQNLRLALSGVTLPSGGTVQVIQPNNAPLTNPLGFGTTDTAFDLSTLSASGTYTVLITPTSAGTGDVTVNLSTR